MKKWSPLCRRHFQLHFLVWKMLCFASNFTETCSHEWWIFLCMRRIQSVHYSDVIMSAMASQITNITTVYSTVYSGSDQRKLRVTGLCQGNSPVTYEFPSQRASNISIWRRHHDISLDHHHDRGRILDMRWHMAMYVCYIALHICTVAARP